jgi:hypothetical protein
MGEGYLNTLAGMNPESQYHCLLPLTPTLAVCLWRGSGYWTEPPMCTIGLTSKEILREISHAISLANSRGLTL